MKGIKFSPDILIKLQKIKKRNPLLFDKIEKQLRIFKENPKHRSLRLHKLTREVKNVWSISIDRSIRMLYIDNDDIYFFEIGNHDEVYRK